MRDHFGLLASRIAFLPIGNDVDTAVYRFDTDDATPYFLTMQLHAERQT